MYGRDAQSERVKFSRSTECLSQSLYFLCLLNLSECERVKIHRRNQGCDDDVTEGQQGTSFAFEDRLVPPLKYVDTLENKFLGKAYQ